MTTTFQRPPCPNDARRSQGHRTSRRERNDAAARWVTGGSEWNGTTESVDDGEGTTNQGTTIPGITNDGKRLGCEGMGTTTPALPLPANTRGMDTAGATGRGETRGTMGQGIAPTTRIQPTTTGHTTSNPTDDWRSFPQLRAIARRPEMGTRGKGRRGDGGTDNKGDES
jgi:hypothetical protein